MEPGLKKKKKKNGGVSLDKGSSVLLLLLAAVSSKVRGQVDGSVGRSSVRCPLLLVNNPSRVSVYIPLECLIRGGRGQSTEATLSRSHGSKINDTVTFQHLFNVKGTKGENFVSKKKTKNI